MWQDLARGALRTIVVLFGADASTDTWLDTAERSGEG
jgi:hypothetical protein